MGWGLLGQDGMGWDGMGWDGMGWGGMGWDGMGRDGTGWDGVYCRTERLLSVTWQTVRGKRPTVHQYIMRAVHATVARDLSCSLDAFVDLHTTAYTH